MIWDGYTPSGNPYKKSSNPTRSSTRLTDEETKKLLEGWYGDTNSDEVEEPDYEAMEKENKAMIKAIKRLVEEYEKIKW